METASEINKENIDSTPKPQTEDLIKPTEKKEEEVLLVGSGKATSLQANFERFRKQKKDQMKYRKYVAEASQTTDRRDPAFKQRLREKFVETAKKYFGVPYAQRYWQPDEEPYKSPIFLDCCALVRQVVYDLRDEFGFQLDRWNQCYQFDTLPIAL